MDPAFLKEVDVADAEDGREDHVVYASKLFGGKVGGDRA